MELKEYTEKIKQILNIENVEELPQKLLDIVLEGGDTYRTLVELVGDNVTIMQSLYQFFLSKRDNANGQDFTPPSLADMVAYLAIDGNTSVVRDMCAGSGALTLACWRRNKSLRFICDEYDEDVIPFLLFTLASQGIEAVVRNGNVITNNYKSMYVTKNGRVVKADIEEGNNGKNPFAYDVAVSNPPYNVKKEGGGLANFDFIREAMTKARDRAAFLLPSGCTTSSIESKDRNEFKDRLDAVIKIPAGTFESTPIPVSCIVFEAQPGDTVRFLDAEPCFIDEVREQRGEDHARARVYKKTFKVLPPSRLARIKSEGDKVPRSEVGDQWRYIPDLSNHGLEQFNHRPINQIVEDLNRVERLKRSIKLTINEKVMREIGATDCLKDDGDDLEELNAFLRKYGIAEVEMPKYMSSTKSAVIKIECKTNDGVPMIIGDFLRMWSQFLRLQNVESNRYLAELRDALLPELMTGTMEVDQ